MEWVLHGIVYFLIFMIVYIFIPLVTANLYYEDGL